jgi:hypothetical protein
VVAGNSDVDSTAHQFALLKGRIHRRLLERLNLANLDKTERDTVIEAIRRVGARAALGGEGPAQFRRA